MIQAILCRWWYGISWPSEEALSRPVPKGYESLDGFSGVYVSTAGGEVGKILDNRNHEECPCFNNLIATHAGELKTTLMKCIEGQMEKLDDKNCDTMKDLEKMKKWCNGVNADKVEKEGTKVAKGLGLLD